MLSISKSAGKDHLKKRGKYSERKFIETFKNTS
ncbi:hypothetical protein Belba_2791 [Belliella baltica DSM 15883]|uniref:Uncharacterized protein n=1 Tax=Belliella baltica (strain DSM 15883 / CIP 108006 / LMG 21964 / BA134) TaxID=866536 RepID=I3Z7V8_BELBD|nr:hypothetical protein Belba_2791 [Belliella baltica DSM 15883]